MLSNLNQKVKKKPLHTSKISFENKKKLNDVISRVNLFMFNIYNFIRTYYIENKSSDELSNDNIYNIFNILKTGNNYTDKNNKHYKYYKDTFHELYFNPFDNELISGKYLDQIMKNNIPNINAAIKNNITYTFNKYINRFIKCYLDNSFKNEKEYYKLIKVCSYYETFINDENIRKNIKSLSKKNNYNINDLNKLADLINKHISNNKKNFRSYLKKTGKNIFYDEYIKAKNFEKSISEYKSTIKKILIEDYKNYDNKDIIILDILKLKSKILPEISTSFEDELKMHPYKFIQNMIFINNWLYEHNYKTFNVFPSRHNIIPKHITIDTASLNVVFLKNKYSKIEENKKSIWKDIFNFTNKEFYMNKIYIFNGTIQTDGVSMSLIYTHKDDYNKKLVFNEYKSEKKKEAFNNKKIITDKITNKYINELNSLKKRIEECKSNKLEIIIKKYLLENRLKFLNQKIENEIKEELKKKNKKEEKKSDDCDNKKKIKEYINELKKNNKMDELRLLNRKKKEFYSLDDLIESELDELRNTKKVIFIDQGKSEILYALNQENDKFMHYSGKERGRVLKTKKHMNNIDVLMTTYGIKEENEKLKEINKKVTLIEELKNNIKIINESNKKLYNLYQRKKLRKEKLEMYIDSQKAEKVMIIKFMNQLNIQNLDELKKYTLIVGDWEGCNSLKNNKTTLGMGMKRLLKNYVKHLYLIDEYNTSKMSNINHNEVKEDKKKEKESFYKCKNLTLTLKSTSKKGCLMEINKKMHGILSFTMYKKNLSGSYLNYPLNNDKEKKFLNSYIINRYIQRDKNAVLNFRSITEHYLSNNRERLIAFKRISTNSRK